MYRWLQSCDTPSSWGKGKWEVYNKCRAVLLRVGADVEALVEDAFSPLGVQSEGWAKGVEALRGMDSSLSEPTESII